jgi:outer membrane protein TolC
MLAAVALLSGCASFSPDGGFSPVEQAARERLGKQVQWVRTPQQQADVDARVSALLAKPLSADDAVQVALWNHRGLQARLFELGIVEAEVVQAGRLPNPGFSFGRSTKGHERELETGLHLNLARLLALPFIGQIEARRFEQAKGSAALAMLTLASETRKAYYNAVAAQESVRYMGQVRQAADASAELARRMEQVGNFNKLARAREQVFQAEAAMNLARAEQLQRATRERLIRQLGVWGTQTQFTLPDRLPDLPKDVRDEPEIERLALTQRLDVQGAKLAAEQTARNLGLTRATRFINVLEVGVMNSRSNEEPTLRGWEIGFELPLFDWGDARVAKAEAVYMQTVHLAAQTAIEARSEVREAYTAYRTAFELARFQRDEVVPLNQRISEENLLRYNGMFIGVFELLADARTQIASVNTSIQALRDFWLAQADLDMALIGKPSLTALAGASSAAQAPAAGH